MANWKDKLGAAYGIKSPETFSPPKKSSSVAATAPYNFVALPEKILPAEFDGTENFREHVIERGKLSGEISLEIETLMPLFIGNDTKSFAPVGTPIIPGSSLRGMFKNIFKIVTCGAFRGQTTSQRRGEDFNDEHIYYRCLMGVGRYPWTKELHKAYTARMIHTDRGRPVKNARPGFLIRTTANKFFIAPSIYKSDRKVDRLEMWQYLQNFQSDKSCVTWDGKRAYIFTGKGGKKKYVRFTSLDYLDSCREHWIALPEDVQTSYDRDRNRRGLNLLDEKNAGILKRADLERLTGKNFSDVKTLIPCHFLEEDGQITAFGHGQCFRIPYKKRIGDAVPKIHQQSEKIVDFADAVFGKEKFWASRVYFEDATPIGDTVRELAEATAHPLMQPNPTSYQLYLDQRGDKLNHWDTIGARIRGYKLYWHKPAADWRIAPNEEVRLAKKMSPLDEGNRFAAKIRFRNLSSVELGALMMIFDLDGLKNAAYKIGQGKPFGFGSVKITPTLYVESIEAYTKLFGADGWQAPCREENPAAYVDAFRKYLADRGLDKTWCDVMKALKKILDWSQTSRPNWIERVKSMSGDVSQADGVDERFKQRKPLPTIFEVVK